MRKIFTGVTLVFAFLLAFSPVDEAGVRKGPCLIYGGNPTQMTVLWQMDDRRDCLMVYEWAESGLSSGDCCCSQS